MVLHDTSSPYDMSIELPTLGIVSPDTVFTITGESTTAAYKGHFTFIGKDIPVGYPIGRLVFRGQSGPLLLDFTDSNHGIYYTPSTNSQPRSISFRNTKITNLRIGGQIEELNFESGSETTINPGDYPAGTKPTSFTVPVKNVRFLDGGFFKSTDTSMRYDIFGNKKWVRLDRLASASTFAIENLQLDLSTDFLAGSGCTITNVGFTADSVTWSSATVEASTVVAVTAFSATDSSHVNFQLTTLRLWSERSTFSVGDIEFSFGSITDGSMNGGASKSKLTITGAGSTTATFYRLSSLSNYLINIPAAQWKLSSTFPISNCEIHVDYLYVSANPVIPEDSSLNVSKIAFDFFSTLTVAHLRLNSWINSTPGYNSTLKALPSATNAVWYIPSSLTLTRGVTIDMAGLNELEIFYNDAAGAVVDADSARLARVYMRPNKLRINWALSTSPTAGTAYKLFQNFTAIEFPSTTTVLPVTVNSVTYDGLLENVISPWAPSGTLGGKVSLRLIQNGLSPAPVHLRSRTSESPYYWDGTSCTTTSTLCSADLPCHVAPSSIAVLPSANEACTLVLAGSTFDQAYSLTVELPEAQSSNPLTLVAKGGRVRGQLTFQPKSGALSATSVHLTADGADSNDGYEFSTQDDGVEFANLPNTFVASFNAKIDNPRIAFSGDTLSFGPNTDVQTDWIMYGDQEAMIESKTSSSKYVLEGGNWAVPAFYSTSSTVKLLGGTSASVTASAPGLKMFAVEIISDNVVLPSSDLTKMAITSTSTMDLSQSVIRDSVIRVGTTLAASSLQLSKSQLHLASAPFVTTGSTLESVVITSRSASTSSSVGSTAVKASNLDFTGSLDISSFSELLDTKISSQDGISMSNIEASNITFVCAYFNAIQSNISISSVSSLSGDSLLVQSEFIGSSLLGSSQLSLESTLMQSSSANVSSIVAKNSSILQSKISISYFEGSSSNSSIIDETCQVFDATDLSLNGTVSVSISAAEVKILNAKLKPSSQLNLHTSALIDSLKVDKGILGVFGPVNVTSMDFQGGKIIGEMEGSSTREIGQNTGNSQVLSAWRLSHNNPSWLMDSNVQLELSNLIIDMQDLSEFKYVANSEDGIFVSGSSPIASDPQVLVSPESIVIIWAMSGVPKVGEEYTMFSGYALFSETSNIVSPNIRGTVYRMTVSYNDPNGRIVFVMPKAPELARAPTAKKSSPPFWAWIILAVGIVIVLAVIAVVLFFVFKPSTTPTPTPTVREEELIPVETYYR